jgi:hypothetical protein
MYYLLRFHANSRYVNAPQCYVIGPLPVLFIVELKVTTCIRVFRMCYICYMCNVVQCEANLSS